MSTEAVESTGNEFVQAQAEAASPQTPVDTGATDTPIQQEPVATETPVEQETPQEAPVEQEQPQDTTAALRAAARRMGLDISDETTPDELAVIALQNLNAMRSAQAAKAKQEEPKPEPAQTNEWDPDRYFEEKWGASWSPEYDQAISQGIVVQDEKTGKYVAAPGYDVVAAPILPKLNEAHQKVVSKWQSITKGNLYKDVYQATRDPIMREVERLVEERMSQVQQQTSAQDYAQQFDEQNADWMYQEDPVTKSYVPTPEGQRLIKAVQVMYRQGETDAKRAISEALEITGLADRVGKKAAKAVAAPAKQEPKETQSPQQSFLEKARQNAYAPNASGPGTDPAFQVNSEADLNNLFVRVYNSR